MNFYDAPRAYVESLSDQQLVDLLRDFDDFDYRGNIHFLENIKKHPLILEALKTTREDWEKYDFNNFWSSDILREANARAAEILKRLMT
jgi:hypothetical protein